MRANIPRDNSLHLYRHLIRQVRVLHDDVTRSYASRIIRLRFEEHRNPTEKTPAHKDLARRWVTVLWRANAGVLKPLLKVLRFGYGRTGPRRWELLKPYLPQADLPPTETHLSPALEALVRSQKKLEPHPVIPETNTWGRPFPHKTKMNRIKHHRTELLRTVIAPLPRDDFARLERFASGKEEPCVPKRKSSLLKFDEKFDTHTKLKERPRPMSKRSWRRMYQMILEETPYLYYNEERSSWQVSFSEISKKQKAIPFGTEAEFGELRMAKRGRRRTKLD